MGATRDALELGVANLQATLQRWGIAPLIDLHVADLLNKQLPSHYDYTSGYDVMVFRRPAALTC